MNARDAWGQHGEARALRAVFENMPGTAVQCLDRDGRVLYWNPASETIYGYSAQEAAGLGLDQLILAPEQFQEIRRRITKVERTGSASDAFDILARTRSGGRAKVACRLMMVGGQNADPVFLCLGTVATEHARTEAALFEGLVESAEDAITSMTPDGFVQTWNAGAERLFGYDRREAVGRPMSFIYSPDASHGDRQVLDIATRSRRIYEVECVSRDGRQFPASVAMFPVQGSAGTTEVIGAIFRDITRRRRAQQALSASEQIWRVAFSEASVGITMSDLEMRFREVNDMYCDIVGYTREELLAMTVRDVTRPEDAGELLEFRDRIKAGEGATLCREKALVRKDGSLVWVSLATSLARGADGEPQHVLSVVQDITERKKSEAALRSANEQLRELAGHLQTVREQERARIAHEIHDELGSALTAVKFDISWYVQKTTHGRRAADERLRDAIQVVDTAIQTVKRIATDLRPSLLDNLGLMAAIEWQVAEFGRRTGIRCRLGLEPPKAWIPPDIETAIFRMVQESLTNVARHSKATEVAVTSRYADGMLTVDVADNGCGLSAERLDDPLSFGIRGMRERARAHQGEVRVTGKPGSGTVVSIVFTVADSARAKAGLRLAEKP